MSHSKIKGKTKKEGNKEVGIKRQRTKLTNLDVAQDKTAYRVHNKMFFSPFQTHTQCLTVTYCQCLITFCNCLVDTLQNVTCPTGNTSNAELKNVKHFERKVKNR